MLLAVFAATSLAAMALIYAMSAQPGTASQGMSDTIVWGLFGSALQGRGDGGGPESGLFHLLTLLVRKSGHVGEFLLLGASLEAMSWQVVQLSHKLPDRIRVAAILAFTAAVAYAASDELHQLCVPGRSGQPGDVLVDAVGILGGIALASWAIHRLRSRRG